MDDGVKRQDANNGSQHRGSKRETETTTEEKEKQRKGSQDVQVHLAARGAGSSTRYLSLLRAGYLRYGNRGVLRAAGVMEPSRYSSTSAWSSTASKAPCNLLSEYLGRGTRSSIHVRGSQGQALGGPPERPRPAEQSHLGDGCWHYAPKDPCYLLLWRNHVCRPVMRLCSYLHLGSDG